MMRASAGLAVRFLAVAVWAASASAQVTTYTSQSAFLAALRPGGVTNDFPDLAPGNYTTPYGPAGYTVGSPYASYVVYSSPGGLFVDNFTIGGQAVKGVGNFQYSNAVYVDFSSNNVGQIGASFFFCDFFGAPVAGDVIVQYSDGTVASVPTNTGGSGGPGYFGISVPTSNAAIKSMVIPRYPPGQEVYVNMGPITTSAFADVALFWSGAGSAGTLGGSGNWSTAGSNWAASAASIGAWNAARRAVFSGTAGTVTVDPAGVSVGGGMAFNVSGVFLDGSGSVSLTGTSSATNDIYVAPSIAPSIGVPLSASGGYTKSGPGTLRITGTATGPATISRGVLQVGDGGVTGVLNTSSVVNNGELEFNRSDSHSFAGSISGSGALYITGGGRTTLSGVGSYTGRTGILSSGTLAITNAAAVGGSTVVSTGSAGTFDVSGLASAYAVPGTQLVVGGGTVLGATTLGGGATLSPGVGRGTITMSGSLSFGGGGNYNWQVDDASLPAGQTGSYDLVSVLGSLSIAASSTNTFKLNLWSVIPDGSSGPAGGFDPTVSSTYTLVTTSGGISGFAANKFTINTSATNGTAGFINDLAGGSFRVRQAGNDLQLLFLPAGASGGITINVASGTQTQTQAGYPLLSGADEVTKTGAGTLVLDQANTLTASTTVQQGKVLLSNASALSSSSLVVVAGGTAEVAPYLVTSVGGLDLAGSGLVDLSNGGLTVVAGLSPTELVAQIVAGRNGGTWDGTSGITSSVTAAQVANSELRAVGWLDNGDGSLTTAYAAQGDTNLDWVVDILDVANFAGSGKYGTPDAATWSEGDFNYDGVVDIQDVADFAASGLYGGPSYNSASGGVGGIAAVPEPSGLAVVAVAVLGLTAGVRRMRRRVR